MDPLKSQSLASFPPEGLSLKKAQEMGIDAKAFQKADHNGDGRLSEKEYQQAQQQDVIQIQSKSSEHESTPVSFVDPPSKPGPKKDYHKGYVVSAAGPTSGTELKGDRPGSMSIAPGTTLASLSQSVKTPDDVTRLLQPFGSAVYDYDRAGGGRGPAGTQSPEYTVTNNAGICRDSHQLGAYLLNQNGYDAIQIGYKAEGVLHAVTAYEGEKGFGLIEYGTHYSPEKVAEALGRPALSYEEALLAIRPESKILNRYSKPEAKEEGYITGLHYAMGNLLYQETLRLKHENSAEWNNQEGVKLEMALSEHFGIKLTANTGSSPDPTARNSLSAALGYQAGNEDNWFRLSTGFQYRPEEGHHSVGGNTWESHPAMVIGGHAEGQWTPFKAGLTPNHQTRTTVSGNFTTGIALTEGEGTDGTGRTVGQSGWELNDGLTAGFTQASVRLSQHFDGSFNEHFSYESEIFLNPDIVAMSFGYGTGGKGIYSNSGVNARLVMDAGPVNGYVGGQYLFTQVNNLEASGITAGLGYEKNGFYVQSDNGFVKSPEGWRLQTQQSIGYQPNEHVKVFGFATQEQIINPTYGNFSGQNLLGAGLNINF